MEQNLFWRICGRNADGERMKFINSFWHGVSTITTCLFDGSTGMCLCGSFKIRVHCAMSHVERNNNNNISFECIIVNMEYCSVAWSTGTRVIRYHTIQLPVARMRMNWRRLVCNYADETPTQVHSDTIPNTYIKACVHPLQTTDIPTQSIFIAVVPWILLQQRTLSFL